MPEVITDTSPTQYRYQIAQLDLRPIRMGRFRMPQAVAGVRGGRVTIVLSKSTIWELPAGNVFHIFAATEAGNLIRGNPFPMAAATMTENVVPVGFLKA